MITDRRKLNTKLTLYWMSSHSQMSVRPERTNVRTERTHVRTYVRPQKSFGRWVMHDSMPYDPIQGQGEGHKPFKVWNPAIFKSYLLRHLKWELATDHGFIN